MFTAADIVNSIADVPIKESYHVMSELLTEFIPNNYNEFRNYDAEEMQFNARFGVKPVRQWTCTDTTVGLYAMFLDGEFVGFANQYYRKSGMTFGWLSIEIAQKIRELIIELFVRFEEPHFMTFSLDTDFEGVLKVCEDLSKD
jgi:hypothetical protein